MADDCPEAPSLRKLLAASASAAISALRSSERGSGVAGALGSITLPFTCADGSGGCGTTQSCLAPGPCAEVVSCFAAAELSCAVLPTTPGAEILLSSAFSFSCSLCPEKLVPGASSFCREFFFSWPSTLPAGTVWTCTSLFRISRDSITKSVSPGFGGYLLMTGPGTTTWDGSLFSSSDLDLGSGKGLTGVRSLNSLAPGICCPGANSYPAKLSPRSRATASALARASSSAYPASRTLYSRSRCALSRTCRLSSSSGSTGVSEGFRICRVHARRTA